jgi:predicted secreted Zn-dependent protease
MRNDKKTRTEVSKITKSLKHEFTNNELLVLSATMAEAHEEQAQAEGKLKSVQAQIKAEVELARAKLASVASKIKARHEYRDFDCEETKDFENSLVTVVRLDTYETVESRPMQTWERQQSLASA